MYNTQNNNNVGEHTTQDNIGISNSEKYNECNPRDDSYCLFEKEAKESRIIIDNIKRFREKFDSKTINSPLESFTSNQILHWIDLCLEQKENFN